MNLDHGSGEGSSNLNPDIVHNVDMDIDTLPKPPTPPLLRRRIGQGDDEHEIIQEFSHGDYDFESKVDFSSFPVLCDPSNSKKTCRYHAVGDTYNTRRTILEATLPRDETRYFNNYFGDKIAVSQLIETNPGKTVALLKQLELDGITSEMHFNKRKKEEEEREEQEEEEEEEEEEVVAVADDEKEVRKKHRRFKGCPKFKIDSWYRFTGDRLNVDVTDIEQEFLPDTGVVPPLELRRATTEIKRFGPIIGEYLCTKDNNKVCQQPIYDQTSDPRPWIENGKSIGHSVMIIGFGIAKKLLTGDMVPYYVIQNNWGDDEPYIGRILTSIFKYAYAPYFANQCDLVDFMANFGNDYLHLVKTRN